MGSFILAKYRQHELLMEQGSLGVGSEAGIRTDKQEEGDKKWR
jgi:hypothetical protein